MLRRAAALLLLAAPAHAAYRIQGAEATPVGVRLELEGRPVHKATWLAHPTRLVIDFRDTTLARRRLRGATEAFIWRVGQYRFKPRPIARLVFELDKRGPFSVEYVNGGLRVNVRDEVERVEIQSVVVTTDAVRVAAPGVERFHAELLKNPLRLALDVKARVAETAAWQGEGAGAVRGWLIRGTSPRRAKSTRIEIELERRVPYQIQKDAAGLRVLLDPRRTAALEVGGPI